MESASDAEFQADSSGNFLSRWFSDRSLLDKSVNQLRNALDPRRLSSPSPAPSPGCTASWSSPSTSR